MDKRFEEKLNQYGYEEVTLKIAKPILDMITLIKVASSPFVEETSLEQDVDYYLGLALRPIAIEMEQKIFKQEEENG